MSLVARNSVAAIVAFIAGAVACWWLTPAAPIRTPKVLRPKSGIVRVASYACRRPWQEPPEFCNRPYRSGRARLVREFASRGDILIWAQRRIDNGISAYCQDPNWCLVLFDAGLLGPMGWNGLFYEYCPSYGFDRKPWKLRWMCYNCVGWAGIDDTPDCAWIEPDSRTLVIATSTGRALGLSQLPREVRHL